MVRFNYMMIKKIFLFTGMVFTFTTQLLAQAPTLVINEVSNGVSGGSGEKEYIELLVIGPKTNLCEAPATLDLRNWVIDDNNGFLGSGGGKGIANGAFRFKNISFWEKIPVGTLILLYNKDDFEASLITNDVSMTDGNCVLVIPCNSNLLESQSISPEPNNPNYPASGWSTPTNWSPIGLRNDGDGVLILRPTNTTTPVYSFGYGDVMISGANVGFSGTGKESVYAMKNTNTDNFNDVTNWSKEVANSTTQTPGKPNNAANESYILSLSNGCQMAPTTIPSLTTTIIQPTTCNKANGVIGSTITGGTQPFSYDWSNGGNNATINNVPAGDYTLIITDDSGCKDTSTISLASSVGPAVDFFVIKDSCDLHTGKITTSVTNGATPYTYSWSNGANTANISNLGSGKYIVEITDANSCQLIDSVTVGETACDITQPDPDPDPVFPIDTFPSTLEMPNVFTPNGDGKNDLYVPTKQENIAVESFTILNRWGNVLFQDDTTILWNGQSHGQDAVPGTYFYLVKYRTILNEEKVEHGFLQLVR